MPKVICPRCWNQQGGCDKCDSTGRVEDVRLSANFMLSEMLRSDTAMARGISNDPVPKELSRIKEATVNLFQPVRNLLGPLRVTSGFRSPALNRAIGGAKNSAHMAGYAMDCQPVRCSLEEAMQRLWESGLQFDQAILELGRHHDRTNDDWLHLGWKHPTAHVQRRQFLRMENGVYSPWEPK